MALIRPFRGIRPRPDVADKVASPPYDVLNSDAVYEKSAENLQKLISEGNLIQDKDRCFYIYRQKMGYHVQTGVVAGASVDEYDSGLIKKHEFTRKDKEADRARHVEVLGANAGPVFLTYRASVEIDEIAGRICSEKPAVDFTADDGVAHTLWVVDSADHVAALEAAFKKVPCLYVADGHHRSAAASRVRKLRINENPKHDGTEQYNFFLAVIFPHDRIRIMDYNRVVKDLGELSNEDFLSRISEKFEVLETDAPKPSEKKSYGMFLGGRWFRMKAKDGTYPANDPVESMDAAILQNNLLDPVLGIKDPRTDERIDFVGGIRGMEELERRCAEDAVAAFALFPTSVEELMAVADAGLVMPPKSTWFEPKLRSGMVIKKLED